MNQGVYDILLRHSKKQFKGTKRLFNYVNIFEPEDLLHDFIASSYFTDDMPIGIMVNDLKQFLSKKIRDAKQRRDAGTVITQANNKMLDNFGDNYRNDDIMDVYIYNRTLRNRYTEPELSDEPYKDQWGNIDYNMMLEDMQKEMGKHDRMYHVVNNETGRQYFVGNPLAIPIENIYYKQEEKDREQVNGMG